MGDEREGHHKLAETLNSKSSLKEKLDIKYLQSHKTIYRRGKYSRKLSKK